MFETWKPFNIMEKKVNEKTFGDGYLRLKRNKYVIHCMKEKFLL